MQKVQKVQCKKNDMSYAVTQLAHLTQCANYAKCVMQFFYEGQKRTRLNKKDVSEKNSMYPKGFCPFRRRPVSPVIGDTSGYMLKCERYYFTSCPVMV